VLEDADYETELQDFDFKPGDSIPRMIEQALERADRVIAVISPHYLERDFTRSERYTGYFADPTGKERFVIPVVVAPLDDSRLFRQFSYVSFVSKDEDTCKRLLLDAVHDRRLVEHVGFPGKAAAPAPARTFIRKLPAVDPYLVGRAGELEWLESAWANPDTNLVQIIAPGGTGKTALMTKWYKRHLDSATIFGWSFYSQGTNEKSQTSSDEFFAEALRWFGIEVKPGESPWTRVDRLVERLRRERVLLILDGVEPLQHPDGSLRDLALKALLEELAVRNAGMVLCTTRVRLIDLPDDPPASLSRDLDNLDPEDGARYLAHLGVRGEADELREASAAYGNHALALTLLGTFLVTFCKSDIRRRTEIRELQVEETRSGRHARKVMASYARMYKGQPELEILRALGYFDRPAEPEALKLVLPEMKERQYLAALQRLREARLVLTSDPTKPLDCHPLIREHFAQEATAERHLRLYEYYKRKGPDRPDTLEEMTPLFCAVFHGCKAGRYQETLDGEYNGRIQRGELFLFKKLGAFGTGLSLLTNFFEVPWRQAAAALPFASQVSLIGEAAFALRAVGRLVEATNPMRDAAEAEAKLQDRKNAASSFGNLSEIHVLLGNLTQAIDDARRSVEYADQCGYWFQREYQSTTLATALHHSGDVAEAKRLFEEAERFRVERQLKYSLLYSVQGYRYCELHLAQGDTAEVLRRASQAMRVAEETQWPLDMGLNHLSLGRAYPAGSAEAAQHLNRAIDFLRLAGTLHHLPRALLARGTPHDLEEVYRIATRSGMRLFLTDYHLASARLCLTHNDRDKAREHVEKAAKLIDATGYHRRDAELAQLRSLVS